MQALNKLNNALLNRGAVGFILNDSLNICFDNLFISMLWNLLEIKNIKRKTNLNNMSEPRRN